MSDPTPEQLREAVEAIAALPCAGCGSAPSVTSDWAECETSGCPFDGVTIRLTAWEAIHRTMAPIAGSPSPQPLGKPRYGRARVTTIIRDFDRLRQAVRSHDTEAIEGAWLNCERWLDFVFGEAWRQSDG